MLEWQRTDTPRSLVDTMLGRLARWVQAMGYGTVYLGAPWVRSGTHLRLLGKGRPRPDGSRGDAYLAVEIVEWS